jgi:NADPH-dependent glutamate synthase beta subunit-like oxidoreductase
MNSIPKGELSKELRDIIISETVTTQVKETKVEEVTESYVSSSPDFVPSQQNHNYRNNRRNNKNKKK